MTTTESPTATPALEAAPTPKRNGSKTRQPQGTENERAPTCLTPDLGRRVTTVRTFTAREIALALGGDGRPDASAFEGREHTIGASEIGQTSREVSNFLRASTALGIYVGTDGDEVSMLAPIWVPTGIRRVFEAAIAENQREFIKQIVLLCLRGSA